eukprot:Gb_12756 [translate_table: standard]
MAVAPFAASPSIISTAHFKDFNGLSAHVPIFSTSIRLPFHPEKSSIRTLKIEAKESTRSETRIVRHRRIRKKLNGTPERPRLAVFRSNKHIYAQVIDDTKMHTLASASTMQKPLSEELKFTSGPTIDIAKKVGEAIAKACLEKGITKVAFDRGGFIYHGRIKALADSAREQGLDF